MTDTDRYKREVGRVYLRERFINLEMVRDGYAWRYLRYDRAGEFMAAEREARVLPQMEMESESGWVSIT